MAEVVAEEERFMGDKEATLYRRGAAKVNYLSLDRHDLGYASKELSRSMARPPWRYDEAEACGTIFSCIP